MSGKNDMPLPKAIGAPATRALTAAGYSHLGQLDGVSADRLAQLHGVGPRALEVLQDALEQHGMTFGLKGAAGTTRGELTPDRQSMKVL